MTDYESIYRDETERYDRLVSREDREGNILPAIERVRSLRGLRVVESGAGTGRLTRLVEPVAGDVFAFDRSDAMLRRARERAGAGRNGGAAYAAADHRALPVHGAAADLVLSGWSVSHLATKEGPDPLGDVAAALAEFDRAIRPGGTTVLLETLGTGAESPSPPENLSAYFRFLRDAGFRSFWIRTDYGFESPAEAAELTRFFFGDAAAERIARAGSAIVPECTGLFWRRRPAAS
ncbi:MAG: class I SAM-dependent methyltransferase [Candidatus Eisenbacteria bacterium]|nr:class I SAM-dependent methyltransferase [Candidatus Eisenbacteria bacterium]